MVVTDDRDRASQSKSARDPTTALRSLKRTLDIGDYLLTRSHFARAVSPRSRVPPQDVSAGIRIYTRVGITGLDPVRTAQL